MEKAERRYDIDWLRVIAIGLLLIYHIAIAFQPWGVLIGFIQSSEPLKSLWIPMAMLNVWRIPLLFCVSGMGVCFAMRKRNFKQLVAERSLRILLPFVFGLLAIVPLHVLLWQNYYQQDLAYKPHPGHLWFLANIFLYVLLLTPLFFWLKKHEENAMIRFFKKLFSSPVGLLLIAIPFLAETLLLNPESYELYAYTWHGFVFGFLAFFFGFIFVLSGDVFWQTALKWRWLFLGIAVILYGVRLFIYELQAPHYLKPFETISWILAVLGAGYRYLNKPGKTLSYLSEGAYPIYILHMVFLYLATAYIFPLEIPVELKFIIVITITGVGCFLSFEIIRRVGVLRVLFGLKTRR